MTERGPATEQDMVDAFLSAELRSPRFDRLVAEAAERHGIAPGDLFLDRFAEQRRTILWAYRERFLEGFPRDVEWRRVEIGREDLSRLRYSSYPAWVELSGGTRQVADGARNVDSVPVTKRAGGLINDDIKALAAAIESEETFPELIAVDGEDGTCILVEGHARATAWAYAGSTRPLRVLLGRSPNLGGWRWF